MGSNPTAQNEGLMAIVYSGVITEITNKYGADEDDVVVYIDDGDGIAGLHISKCVGFTPKVGDKVNIFKDSIMYDGV